MYSPRLYWVGGSNLKNTNTKTCVNTTITCSALLNINTGM